MLGTEKMGNNGGFIRYITVCFICLLIYVTGIYKGFENAKISTANPKFAEIEEQQAEKITTQVEIKQTEEKKEEKGEEKSTSSVAASTPEVYKGRVISRYISPYTAKLCYGKVYMKNSTGLDIDIKKLLNSKISFKINKNDEPQVLIVHTHTSETFMKQEGDVYTESFSSRTQDKKYNMVMIGKIVAKKLNSAGIKTLHDETVHDYPEYNGSYNKSAATIKKYLKKYPSIKVVLDLHRDAISSGDTDKVKLVTEIKGEKAAQVMLVMGSQSGSVTNFPNWQENLKLALRVQAKIEEKYPTLARPLSLVSRNYNESLTKGSMLIEFGTDVNTIDEVSRSAEYVGDALSLVLGELK